LTSLKHLELPRSRRWHLSPLLLLRLETCEGLDAMEPIPPTAMLKDLGISMADEVPSFPPQRLKSLSVWCTGERSVLPLGCWLCMAGSSLRSLSLTCEGGDDDQVLLLPHRLCTSLTELSLSGCSPPDYSVAPLNALTSLRCRLQAPSNPGSYRPLSQLSESLVSLRLPYDMLPRSVATLRHLCFLYLDHCMPESLHPATYATDFPLPLSIRFFGLAILESDVVPLRQLLPLLRVSSCKHRH
jgi:hypothetical protein